MHTTSLKTDSMIYFFYKKIENITFRIKAIQKSYNKIYDVKLKIRLVKEYENLEINFFRIKSLVKIMSKSSIEKTSISKLLDEKCSRCENEIFKNKYLFST